MTKNTLQKAILHRDNPDKHKLFLEERDYKKFHRLLKIHKNNVLERPWNVPNVTFVKEPPQCDRCKSAFLLR